MQSCLRLAGEAGVFLNTDAKWRMRPSPTLSREWTYFLTLADLRADFQTSGTELAEVEVFDGDTYGRYGLLSQHGLVRWDRRTPPAEVKTLRPVSTATFGHRTE